jgi:NADH-quinone oxidoreductase subunit K
MLTININFILSLTCIVFFIGLLGIILNRKNILTIIMSIELLLLVNLNFAAFSIYLDDIGQIFVLFVLTIAATESIGSDHNIFYRKKLD